MEKTAPSESRYVENKMKHAEMFLFLKTKSVNGEADDSKFNSRKKNNATENQNRWNNYNSRFNADKKQTEKITASVRA